MTEIPTIIEVSKEAYRMYRAMCKGEADEGDEMASPTAISKRKKSGRALNKIFPGNTQAFLLATAIGMLQSEKKNPGKDTAELIRGEYLRNNKNFDVFKQLVKSKYGTKTDHEVVDLMVQFSEFGVRELYDEFRKTGDIDFARLSKSAELGSYVETLENRSGRESMLAEIETLPVLDLIEKGENDFVEFKSSLIWDYKNEQPSKEMKMVVARTISCFMNSNGGILLIGVSDDKKILGLDSDLSQLHMSHDEFEQTFTNAINTYLGKVNRAYAALRFEKVNGRDIAVVKVKKSQHPVYMRYEGKKEEFYIRSGNSCQPLDISDANLYIKEHWPDSR